MSLSSGTRLLREGCSHKKLGVQAGSSKSSRSENRRRDGSRVLGWRCEGKSGGDGVKVEERVCKGPAAAARRAVHDAMLVCEAAQSIDLRARHDFRLLSRRAREGVARLGSNFLKLDARAREDVEKLDTRARMKMMRLRHIAMGLSESASMELSSAAEEHWSDGALDADLRLADLRARRRAMEDLYVALQAVKNVHTALARTLRVRKCKSIKPLRLLDGKDGVAADYIQGFRSSLRSSDPKPDRLTAIQDACFKMAAALVEAEGMECTDPDDLEFIVAALLDMEEVDGGGGALLVTESASSPDVATRLALADALADAPSLWTLGNAGMGALQRLSMDSNREVAAAASKAITELKSQWSQQDQLVFPFQQKDKDAPQGES